MTRADRAEQAFYEGYSCAQSVLLAYADALDADIPALMRLASSFGGGMGRLREVCGAVTGMFMAAGLIAGPEGPADREAKAAHYKLIQDLAAKFKEKQGSIICREILGARAAGSGHVPEERTAEYYRRRPCVGCIRLAAEILEETLNV